MNAIPSLKITKTFDEKQQRFFVTKKGFFVFC